MKNVLNSIVLAVVLGLAACAPDNSGGGGGGGEVAVVPQANTCVAGQVYTQYGCVPQGTCPVNFGLYNNQCIPTYVNGTGGYYMNEGSYNFYYYKNRNSRYNGGYYYYGY